MSYQELLEKAALPCGSCCAAPMPWKTCARPAVIDALVRGASDPLSLLDEVGGEQLDEAA